MKLKINTILKYIFSFTLIVVASFHYKNFGYFFFGLSELVFIYSLTQIIMEKNVKLGNIFNSVKLGNIFNSLFILLLNVNMIILIFATSFLSNIMLANIASIKALSTKLFIYVPAMLIVVILSIIPVKKSVKIKRNPIITWVIIYFLVLNSYGISYSPFGNYVGLLNIYVKEYQVKQKILNMNYDKNEFLKSELEDYVKYNGKLGKRPNIILIFTEGLSSNVIDDERNIMPNIKEYREKSINFSNYYNHSAATYRGLIGQLYSGFQYDHYDKNNLVSIQSVLKDNKYFTEFINVEPTNTLFVDYLKSFQFDELVSPNYDDLVYDKEAYDFLFNEASRLHENKMPFFLSIYTYQTHVGCDSNDEKYGNGDNNVLNRFYNTDNQFGMFMKKFNESSMFNDTIIVFTTDHASYVDADYYSTFSNYKRDFNFLDKIPLFIYHKGVEVKDIDVNGRNSLDLAPTILDYIDIFEPNYFLGTSLFGESKAKYNFDYYFSYPGAYYSTFNSQIKEVVETKNSLIENLSKYFSIAKKEEND